MNWLPIKLMAVMVALAAGILEWPLAGQQLFALVLIALVGIPHGATDHVLYNYIQSKSHSSRINFRFLLVYLAIIGVYAVLWWFIPSGALALFLIVSAYHFGEAQLQGIRASSLVIKMMQLLWGSFVLGLIFYFNALELQSFVVPYFISELLFNELLIMLPGYLVMDFLLLSGSLLAISPSRFVKEFFELTAILIISLASSLILSFSLFFVIWHARDAVVFQINKIRQNHLKFDWIKWSRKALPTTIISLLGLGLILIVGQHYSDTLPIISLFFVIVALITLPHVIVMSKFIHLD